MSDTNQENPLLTRPVALSLEQRPRTQVLSRHAHERAAAASAAPSPTHTHASSSPATCSRLALDHQEVYAGETTRDGGRAVPHGYGVVESVAGRHCYVGGFSHGWRDGYGHLVTDTFSLWCRWRSNRPDMAHGAVRVDGADGTRYNGMAQLRVLRGMGTKGPQLSKFTQWVQQVRPCRQGWGELVMPQQGERYFGEWSDDVPHGFGCYLTAAGDRYVGHLDRGTFHGTGTLFVHSPSVSSALPHLTGVSVRTDASRSSRHTAAAAEPVEASYCGVVLDGVWCGGRFDGEGHVTLPTGSRVTAEWLGPAQAQRGETVWTSGAPRAAFGLGSSPASRECFHWEPLLGGVRDDVRRQEVERFSHLRAAILQFANSPERVRATVLTFLQSEQSMARSAIKIFVRCFFFLHGTCTGSHTTAVPPSATAGKEPHRVGWCDLRQPFGGCIHSGQVCARSKTQSDIDLALCDVLSFTRSMQRWTFEILGGPAAAAADSHGDTALDALLASGAEQLIGRWTIDTLLADIGVVLSNLYERVYSAGEASLQTSLHRLRNTVTLDDVGVEFARRESEERLFNPYVDAVRCVEQLCDGELTLTRSLQLLVQVSREIDVATRLALSDEVGDVCRARGAGASTATRSGKPHKTFQSGSADDLLPIHQYVLIQATAPHLYARAKLLCDLGAEPSFVEQTSQEGFCLTTLQVCVWALSQLHPFVRDAALVLVPPTVVLESVQAVLAQSESWVREMRLAAAEGEVAPSSSSLLSSDLARACRGYVAMWLPHVLGTLGAAGTASWTLELTSCTSFDQSRLAHLSLAAGPTPAELRWLCWRFAASLLLPAGMRLETRMPAEDWRSVPDLPLDAVCAVTPANHTEERQRSFRLVLLRPALPSLLLHFEALLSSSLQ